MTELSAELAAVDAARTALLVMDYQPAIITSLGDQVDVEALLGRVEFSIETARKAGVHIGYVRSAFTDDDFAAIPETNKVFAPHVPTRWLHHEDSGASVHARLAPQPVDLDIRKTRLGAFSTSSLDTRLRERNIKNLILCGIHTKGVLLATVVEAVDADYRVYVLADASADPDPELHATLVERVFSFQAHVLTTGLVAVRGSEAGGDRP
ncbi:MAG TPA: cysteine hydrolase [Trebonia sp.]|jgi:nicotinamidase-related amidase